MSVSRAAGLLLASVAAVPASNALGADVVELARGCGIQGGLIVHLGCGDASQTAKLRLSGQCLVHGLDASSAVVQAARSRLLAAGQYGPVSLSGFDGVRLPYVDNLVNLVVCEGTTSVPEAEVLRVLAPLGVAMLGNRRIVKPWPAEIDQWTHFLHGPDNNAVAQDRVAAAPRSIQWVAEPRWGRSHEELASMSAAVTAQGRLFYIVDEAPLASIRFLGQWKLVARDAFNGVLLWKQSIPVWTDHLRHFRSGPAHLPRRLVAAGSRVYVTLGLGAPVTALDAATGQAVRVFEGTEHTEEILLSGGVLYLAAGTSESDRRGGGLFQRGEPEPTTFRSIMAIEADSGRVQWSKTFGKDETLLPLTLAVAGQSVFYQSTVALASLDARTGRQRWRALRSTPSRRLAYAAPTLVAAGDVVLSADYDATDKDTPAGGVVQWGIHGWSEPGFERRGKSTLRAYDADTGKQLWSAPCSEGCCSPVDVFVVNGTVWVGADYAGYDLKTGQPRGKLAWRGDPVGMPHHRCYRNKATKDYLFTGRSGVEVVSWERGWLGNNSWLRGTCQYGIMPANGLLYAPPNACACYGKVKTPGFFAAAPQRSKDGRMPLPSEPVLEKGAAYEEVTRTPAGADDWPTYRGDAARSGVAATSLPTELKRRWRVSVGGRLAQPVVADAAVFVASIDAHTVHALKASDGSKLWTFTAGGRIDSPPTIHEGRLLFGSADGWVYCLRASDGVLAWRFRAAPQDRLAVAYGQLESVWPVHGAVLVQNGILYTAAGRSSYLDSGIVLYALDPVTGKQRSRRVISHIDPDTGKQIGAEGGDFARFDMEGVYSDILSGDGQSVFLKHLRYDRACQPVAEGKPHLFAVTGLLGEEWFVRSYWLIADNVGAGWSNWAKPADSVPFGRILCVGKDRVYGYGRTEIAGGPVGHRADSYHLYARDRAAGDPAPAKGREDAKRMRRNDQSRPTQSWADSRWSDTKSLIVRAMVLAGDQLVIAGPLQWEQKQEHILAFVNESDARAGFEGRKGVFLRVVSASNGAKRFETSLPAIPVFDGMSAAGGGLYIALVDGSVECLGGQ